VLSNVLVSAVLYGRTDIFNYLLEQGAVILESDAMLSVAGTYGHIGILKKLLTIDKEAYKSAYGNSITCCIIGYTSILTFPFC
jgi:ankyrin repeat protein